MALLNNFSSSIKSAPGVPTGFGPNVNQPGVTTTPLGASPSYPTQNIPKPNNTVSGQINPQQRQAALSQLADMKQRLLVLQQQANNLPPDATMGNPPTMGTPPPNAQQVPPPTPQPPQPDQNQPAPNPFTAPPPPFGSAVGALAQTAAQPTPEFQAALKQYQDAAQQIAATKADYANQTKFIQGGRTNLQEAGGQQGLLLNAFNQQLAAQAGLQEAAARQAGIATGQQQVQQQGLGAAATLAQPQLGQYGQAQYSPYGGLVGGGTGGGIGGGTLNPINNIQSLAQQVVNGQISPQQAYAMGGSVQNFQGALNAAINQLQPGFNVAQAQGRFEANQQNTTTRGVTPTNTAAAAYAQNYPQQLQIQGNIQNVQGLGQLLIDTGGKQINPFDLTYANEALSKFRSRLSQDQQIQFNQSLATYAGALSQLLANSSNVTPTQVSQWTNGILDGSLKMSALKASYQQALTEGQIKLQSAQAITNIPGQIIGAPKVGAGQSYQDYLKAIGK